MPFASFIIAKLFSGISIGVDCSNLQHSVLLMISTYSLIEMMDSVLSFIYSWVGMPVSN